MRKTEKIWYHLLNYERNEELLGRIAHIPYLDLAIIFSIKEEEEGPRRMITQEKAKDLERLEELAAVNTPRSCPACFHPLDDVIRGLEAEMGIMLHREPSRLPMYLLTNAQKFLGASVILYPGLLHRLGSQLEEDFYILPSSVHECILVPESAGCGREELREMVRSVNDTQVPPQEILSYQVYYYSVREDCIYSQD